jgi:hypothetical protein
MQNLLKKTYSYFFSLVVLLSPIFVYADSVLLTKRDNPNLGLITLVSIMKGLVGLLIVLSIITALWSGISIFAKKGSDADIDVSGYEKATYWAMILAAVFGATYWILERIYIVITFEEIV